MTCRQRLAQVGRSAGWVLMCLTLVSTAAHAQDEIARAREMATKGQRVQAIALLRELLQKGPDADARLLLGTYLSWEGDYNQARTELEGVLRDHPDYLDVVAALLNVELWSGHPQRALELAQRGIAAAPNDDRFLTGRRRANELLDLERAWSASAGYSYEWFSHGRSSWTETWGSLKRATPAGAFIVTGYRAERFEFHDQSVAIEAYPHLWRGAYGYVAAAFAPEAALYPGSRYAFDVYQSLGRGVEASAGMRRLNFATSTNLYVVTLNKYVGNWLVTGRMFYVPDPTGQNSRSFHGSFRRYFGPQGTSYVGARYSRGFARTEVRSINDFELLGSDTFASELSLDLRRYQLTASGSTSRQDRIDQAALGQHSFSIGFGLKF